MIGATVTLGDNVEEEHLNHSTASSPVIWLLRQWLVGGRVTPIDE